MGWHIQDHGAFQRGALLLVAVGGAVGVLCGLIVIDLPGALLAAAVGTAALACALTEAHARRRGPALPLAAVALGLTLAWLSWRGLSGEQERGFTLAEGAAAGALFGLVAGLGLLPVHLGRTRRDRVAEALAAARRRFAGQPGADAEEATLVQRAADAHARIRAGLVDPDSKREVAPGGLRAEADALTLQVIELAGRCRELRRELVAVDPAEVEGRGVALAQAAESTDDPAAREDFARAARTTVELRDRLRAMRAAQDRLRARLSLQVTILESTALALSTRSASSMAHAASALAPLAERVREAGADLEAEALAFAETQA